MDVRRVLVVGAVPLVMLGGVAAPSQAAPAAGVTVRAESWREIGLPYLWPRNRLHDVAATGPRDVWITGHQGSVPIFSGPLGTIVWTEGNPVVRRWDGARWHEYPLNGFTGGGRIATVSAHGSEVWISGHDADGPYAARFDGTAFVQVAPPSGLYALEIVTGAAGTWLISREQDVNMGLFRWEGGAFVRQPMPARTHLLTDVVATAPGEAWAVGSRLVDGVGGVPMAVRWRNGTWKEAPLPGDLGARRLSSAAATRDGVWATAGPSDDNVPVTALIRWTGTAWTRVPLPADTDVRVQRVTADGNGAPLLVAERQVTGFPTVLFRRTGDTWTRLPAPAATVTLQAVTGVPGTSGIWGVGLKRNGDNQQPVAVTTTP
ncbi:hypothetical protein [Spirillospora albida]|uniref:hypothetical protein n=1 Tax=Spirillospora albida TaxID=58123 RepID=UPI0004C21FD5|nr:hypothetical protein [Spirillospora albida]